MANYINAAANLKKKGAAANPNGRPPKGYSITEWFKEMFASNPEVKDALGKAILKKALEGDQAAVRLIWQYMDGMAQQRVDHTSGDKPIPILGTLLDVQTDNSDKKTSETE